MIFFFYVAFLTNPVFLAFVAFCYFWCQKCLNEFVNIKINVFFWYHCCIDVQKTLNKLVRRPNTQNRLSFALSRCLQTASSYRVAKIENFYPRKQTILLENATISPEVGKTDVVKKDTQTFNLYHHFSFIFIILHHLNLVLELGIGEAIQIVV